MDGLRDQLLMAISAPVIVATILFEVVWTRGHSVRAYSWRETLTNGWCALLNGSLDLLMRGIGLAVLTWCWQNRAMDLEAGWIYWLALFVAEDFAYYTLHWVDHHCRFFWAVHVTHHSSEEFNLSTGFRSSVFQPLYRFIYFAPLAWLGFAPLDVLFMYAATQIYGAFVHTAQVGKLGWLEWLLVTPSHHRVHHASNARYLDRNMGMCLIVWDRLFGTFAAEDDAEPPRYGLTKPVADRGPVAIVFHEWREMLRDVRAHRGPLREKLGYIFARPGWRPR